VARIRDRRNAYRILVQTFVERSIMESEFSFSDHEINSITKGETPPEYYSGFIAAIYERYVKNFGDFV
jgi:hypothetical protein